MQKALSNISSALPKTIEQYVVYFGTEEPNFFYNAEQVNLNVSGSGTSFWKKIFNFFKRLQKLQAFVEQNQIDVVISFGEIANILNLLTRGKRAIISVRVSLSETLIGIYGCLYSWLIRFFYPKADAIVAVSDGIAHQLVSQFRISLKKIHTIHNFYDREQILTLAGKPLSAGEQLIFDNPTVISVGSLNYQKGQDILIRGFALAKAEHSNLQLVLLGEGEERDRLQGVADSLNVADAVHFLGFQSNPYRYLARARIFALTSKFEGFPSALVEAMICGCPVISTDCPTGPREIFSNADCGILLPAPNSRDFSKIEYLLARAIIELLDKKKWRVCHQAAIKQSKDFCLKNISNEWLKLISDPIRAEPLPMPE